MGNIYRNHNTFEKELQKCVDNALIVEDFKVEWKTLVSKYELDDLEHMKYLYEI